MPYLLYCFVEHVLKLLFVLIKMNTRVSMSDALSNVEVLYELPLIDSQPSVEGANNAIVYEANFDTNFEDKTAYITGISKYIEEAVLHSNLV